MLIIIIPATDLYQPARELYCPATGNEM